MKKRILSSIILFGFLFCLTPITVQADGDFLGDFCWSNGTATIKLGISHLGGGHYLCSGITSVTDPIVLQFPTHGNVEFIGNKIIITLSLQGRRYDSAGGYTVGIEMYTITLDPQTLNGTMEGIAVYSDKIEMSEGTVTYTTCQ